MLDHEPTIVNYILDWKDVQIQVKILFTFFFRGNWIGEAPYKVGVPCSACPPSYGGSCSNNMCFPALKTNYLHWFK